MKLFIFLALFLPACAFSQQDTLQSPLPPLLKKQNGQSVPRRKILRVPNIAAIQSEESCIIRLKLLVDERGNIISAECLLSQSTTSNRQLIDAVITAVKEQAKYEEKNPAVKSTETILLSVKVDPETQPLPNENPFEH